MSSAGRERPSCATGREVPRESRGSRRGFRRAADNFFSSRPTRYFVAYEIVKERLTPEGQDPASLSLGAVCVAGALACVPFQVGIQAVIDHFSNAQWSRHVDHRYRALAGVKA
mgnify:CR=1 FL=1